MVIAEVQNGSTYKLLEWEILTFSLKEMFLFSSTIFCAPSVVKYIKIYEEIMAKYSDLGMVLNCI